jgi:hypothetical protein
MGIFEGYGLFQPVPPTAATTGIGLRIPSEIPSFSGNIDSKTSPAEIRSVERRDGGLRLLVVHFNESESARPTGGSVRDQGQGMYFTMLCKEITNLVLGRSKRKVTDIDPLSHARCSISAP